MLDRSDISSGVGVAATMRRLCGPVTVMLLMVRVKTPKLPGLFGTSLARGTVNAAALLSLLTGGVLAALRGLHVVFPMLGVAGLALAAATDEGALLSAPDRSAHVYADTMGFAPPAIRLATDLLGADHVVVGGDWPVAERFTTRERVEAALRDAGLGPDDSALVAGANTMRLLGRG